MLQKFPNLLVGNRVIFQKAPEKKEAQGESQVAGPKASPDKPEDKSKKERADLADKPAQAVADSGETTSDEPKAGSLHDKFLKYHDGKFNKDNKTPEKVTEIIDQDRKKLSDSSIKNIRFNSRLLVQKNDKETEENQIINLKQETARRIRAYTDSIDGQWYTLNYQNMGGDKRGLSHEFNIGLGDILLDPDIKDVLVQKKDGTIIKAHRGVVPIRQHYAGRLGFLDENNEYVATFTGDKFRILSNSEVDIKDQKSRDRYLKEYAEDEKTRKENESNFENDLMAMEDQEVYYVETDLDPNKSIVEQIRSKLNPQQREMASIIEKEFKEAGFAPGIIAAAIVNAYKESGLRSEAIGDGGHSVGLFQLHDQGAGYGMTVEERKDPTLNTRRIIEVVNKRGGILISRASAGASVTELTAIFSRDIERPADKYGAMQRRAKQALVMFGERVSNTNEAVAYRIDNNEKGYNGKGILKLRSNQDTWIFGSSGAVAMNALSRSLNLGNTGFFGIIGISPSKFRDKLKETWPKIAQLKLPKQIVLVGMGANNPDLDSYDDIKRFLEDKGAKVKIATVQPVKGYGEQISAFNNKLREKYQSDTLIDIAKYTTTEDGKQIKPEYASADGMHLSNRGYHELARLIREEAEKEKEKSS